MEVRINLTPEEVRKIIERYVSNQLSKHGHPGDRQQHIFFGIPEGDWKPLEELNIGVEAVGEDINASG